MSATVADLPVNTNSLNTPIAVNTASSPSSSSGTGGLTSALSLVGNALKTLAVNTGADPGLVQGINTGTGVLSGAATGAAIGSVVPIIGTTLGAIIGGLFGGAGGFFGSGSGKVKGTKSAENISEDTAANRASVKRAYFSQIVSGQTNEEASASNFTGYYGKLSTDELNAIEEGVDQALQQNPYWGLNSNPDRSVNYTSPISGATYTVDNAAGIAKVIDTYIGQREATLAAQQEQEAQTSQQNAMNQKLDNATLAIQQAAADLGQGKVLSSNVTQASNSSGISLLNSKTITNGAMIIAVAIIAFVIFKKEKIK